jgi:hypothetical protein
MEVLGVVYVLEWSNGYAYGILKTDASKRKNVGARSSRKVENGRKLPFSAGTKLDAASNLCLRRLGTNKGQTYENIAELS